jgi:hypothetical protein
VEATQALKRCAAMAGGTADGCHDCKSDDYRIATDIPPEVRPTVSALLNAIVIGIVV